MIYTSYMKNAYFVKSILLFLAVIFIGVLGFIYFTQSASPLAGSFNPTGGGTYYLQSSVNSTATSITLSSFAEPVSGILYTMTYLNSSIEYATIQPGTSNSEFISFSGITQNSDGSATLTGITRGLGRSYPYTASTTLQQPHSGRSVLILSNPPQLTNQYFNLSNANTALGTSTFSATTTMATTTFNYAEVGTTTATTSYIFIVNKPAGGTTTAELGDWSTATSKVCINTKSDSGANISFYFHGTSIVVEANRCR